MEMLYTCLIFLKVKFGPNISHKNKCVNSARNTYMCNPSCVWTQNMHDPTSVTELEDVSVTKNKRCLRSMRILGIAHSVTGNKMSTDADQLHS